MRVCIAVTNQGVEALDDARHASWVGEVAWPSVPPEGATWVHCGGWSGEEIADVYWCGPGDDNGGSSVQIEVRTTAEVVQHLVDHHGFTDQ